TLVLSKNGILVKDFERIWMRRARCNTHSGERPLEERDGCGGVAFLAEDFCESRHGLQGVWMFRAQNPFAGSEGGAGDALRLIEGAIFSHNPGESAQTRQRLR